MPKYVIEAKDQMAAEMKRRMIAKQLAPSESLRIYQELVNEYPTKIYSKYKFVSRNSTKWQLRPRCEHPEVPPVATDYESDAYRRSAEKKKKPRAERELNSDEENAFESGPNTLKSLRSKTLARSIADKAKSKASQEAKSKTSKAVQKKQTAQDKMKDAQDKKDARDQKDKEAKEKLTEAVKDMRRKLSKATKERDEEAEK
jgi:hypothetical protein